MCIRERHACKKLCFETCGDCLEMVTRTLRCGHTTELACYIDEEKYLCNQLVDDILPLCKHATKRKCHQKVEEVACSHPCEDRLDCGHSCTLACHKTKDPDHLTVSRIPIIEFSEKLLRVLQ